MDKLTKNGISAEDLEVLKKAKTSMEDIGFLMKGINSIGGTIESVRKYVPKNKQKWISGKIEKLLLLILKANLKTMKKGRVFKKPSSKMYKALVTTTGAISGSFGTVTPFFVFEMGLSTKFMMRTIMDIARGEGEDLYTLETQLACLEVFALGGKSKDDDGMETTYYTSRIGLNSAMKGASSYITSHGVDGISKALISSGNPLGRLLGIVASRYTVQVSEKMALQFFPVIGAVTGGGINFLFINHFQKMAKAHFTIRRLERAYGVENIKELYELAI